MFCNEILENMPTLKSQQTFGSSGEPGVEVSLPLELANSTFSSQRSHHSSDTGPFPAEQFFQVLLGLTYDA